MTITCTRKLQFCAGHRVMGHENKCAHLHGHNYILFVTAQMEDKGHTETTDEVGRVIDFSVIKSKVGGWVEANWDHGFILNAEDKRAQCAIDFFNEHSIDRPMRQKLHLMPDNPTAENMARFLLLVICPRLFRDTQVIVTEITLWETENCYATVRL